VKEIAFMAARNMAKKIGIIAAVVLVICGLIYFLLAKFLSVEEIPVDGKAGLARLRAIPYINYTEDKVDGSESGVVVHDRDRAWPGYNLYCSRSAPEAFLIDMEGEVVHKWSYPEPSFDLWDYAIMLDQGELVVVQKFKKLMKLDRDSKLIWARSGINPHHDVAVDEDGSLFVIGKITKEYRGERVRFSTIKHLASDGRMIGDFSTFYSLERIKQAFDTRSFLDTKMDEQNRGGALRNFTDRIKALVGLEEEEEDGKKVYVYFHANTLTILPDSELGRRDGRFRKGNLLTCFRNVNQIAVLDRDNWNILWVWGEGVLEEPHHPTLTDEGTILIFDNGVHREYSKIIEIDPLTLETVWEYASDPPEEFFSPTKGSAQRLPNGNTLVCDGDSGRSFEVTRDGEIVWEWLNPKLKEGYRETVYRMIRLEPDKVAKALQRPELSMEDGE
jgi:hypothetical protein